MSVQNSDGARGTDTVSADWGVADLEERVFEDGKGGVSDLRRARRGHDWASSWARWSHRGGRPRGEGGGRGAGGEAGGTIGLERTPR